MKSITCKQLGGGCDKVFEGNNFEELAEASKNHGMEMMQKGDEKHIRAMTEIKQLMKSPGDMKAWYEKKKKEFEALPDKK